jgi:membrane-associated phospholipid phosphatase
LLVPTDKYFLTSSINSLLARTFFCRYLKINIPKIYKKADHFNTLILTLKDYLNMPRPYQLLPYYPQISIKVEYSPGAISASAPSGHAFFGFLFGFLIYNSEQYFFDNNYYEMDRLINIALDVGYHRNMGGIHFLYDNYISYKTFKEFISVYEYDIECKYVTMISKIFDKMFIIYE